MALSMQDFAMPGHNFQFFLCADGAAIAHIAQFIPYGIHDEFFNVGDHTGAAYTVGPSKAASNSSTLRFSFFRSFGFGLGFQPFDELIQGVGNSGIESLPL